MTKFQDQKTVSIIGSGRIGRPIADFVRGTPGFRLGRVLTRGGVEDTSELADFLSTPCDLVVDSAGPAALKSYGAACMEVADVWTVGAAALVDEALRKRMQDGGRANRTVLRLFSPWVAGIGQVAAGAVRSLELRVRRPGLGQSWRGKLREGVTRFPNELNFAVAAALCGPGLDAVSVHLAEGPSHAIDARVETALGTFNTSVSFDMTGRHPTAEAIIAALEQWDATIRYG